MKLISVASIRKIISSFLLSGKLRRGFERDVSINTWRSGENSVKSVVGEGQAPIKDGSAVFIYLEMLS